MSQTDAVFLALFVAAMAAISGFIAVFLMWVK